ncbi:hypothetical protein ABKN59_009685 [Abortiporus biennis]
MSSSKYADLPDVDTSAPDLYETEDPLPSSQDNRGDSSDDETGAPSRSHNRKNGDVPSKEELDMSNLMDTEEASKKFRKAEKKHHRPRIQYTYPPSPTSSSGRNSPTLSTPALPLSQRLKKLQAELSQLETELADPSNPLLTKEKEESVGELIRGVVDVKGRIDKISKVKEGRGKLVSAVLGEDNGPKFVLEAEGINDKEEKPKVEEKSEPKKSDVKEISEMDKRVGELEKIIGSSSAPLDELSPLPPPLLPLLTRLNTQLTLLTQPRHIDSISRRLKLLLSDLDRVSSANTNQHHPSAAAQRRQQSHHPPQGSSNSASHPGTPNASQPPSTPSPLQEQLTPILTRLAPLLPHIPHILTRLRTLSALHTAAAEFQNTLEGLEEEQRKNRSALEELEKALQGVEMSLKENDGVVKNNVRELEERVQEVNRRVEQLSTAEQAVI